MLDIGERAPVNLETTTLQERDQARWAEYRELLARGSRVAMIYSVAPPLNNNEAALREREAAQRQAVIAEVGDDNYDIIHPPLAVADYYRGMYGDDPSVFALLIRSASQ